MQAIVNLQLTLLDLQTHSQLLTLIPTPDPTNIPALSPSTSPPRQLREPPGAPSTPESPTFVTPPSSPAPATNLPNSVGEQPTLPETPALPRRSTRVSRPPDRLTYSQF